MDKDLQPGSGLPAVLRSLVAELYQQSGGGALGLGQDDFAGALQEIRVKYLPADAGQSETRALFLSLRVEELALARACSAGSEKAWETFLCRYREKLYDIATYIAKESSAARELADSLYADLYGTVTRDGKRVCKLASYTGRGSLEGWMRTVLAQEYVNRYRKQRRLVSLDEESEEGGQFAAPDPGPQIALDPRLETATDQALAALPAEDRYVLASYYLDGRTLADIARTLHVHESTVSRKLDKLTALLRKQILTGLGSQGMSRRQAEEALEVDVRDVQINLRDRLTQEAGSKPFLEKKAQAGEGPV